MPGLRLAVKVCVRLIHTWEYVRMMRMRCCRAGLQNGLSELVGRYLTPRPAIHCGDSSVRVFVLQLCSCSKEDTLCGVLTSFPGVCAAETPDQKLGRTDAGISFLTRERASRC